MMNRQLALSAIALLLLVRLPLAAEALLPFDTPAEELRFQNLTSELRCLVCQNQSLADSHADLAGDLRQEIYRMMRDHKTDREIIDFLVQRYGDFVLYRPLLDYKTLALWFGPAVLLLAGGMALARGIRKRDQQELPALSNEQQRRISALLSDDPTDRKQ